MTSESDFVLVNSPQATPATGYGMGTPGMGIRKSINNNRVIPSNNNNRVEAWGYLHQIMLNFLRTQLPLTTNLQNV